PNRQTGMSALHIQGSWRAHLGWLLAWDYYPANPVRAGFVGLVSGADDGGSEIECDYFLLKAGNLPPVTVTLPAQKPALAGLIAGFPSASGAFPIQLTGEASRSYQIDASTNLANWIGLGVVASSNGPAQYLDATATNFDKRFYRARLLP